MGSQKKTRKRKKNRVIKEGILSWILANRLIMVSLILFLVAGAAGITFYYAYGCDGLSEDQESSGEG
jgi:hypothetical protein